MTTKPTVLGISTSPRDNSNTDILLRVALEAASDAGAKIRYVRARDLSIAGCTACNACFETGRCVVQDDYQAVEQAIREADVLIIATPVFFLGPCAQAKAIIDRGQAFWAAKYVLKSPPREPCSSGPRRAMVIAIGGTPGRRMFSCIQLTMKCWLDAVDMTYAFNLFVNRVDEADAIRSQSTAMEEARRLASHLVAGIPDAQTLPVTVALFASQ